LASSADDYLESYWPERPNNPDMWQDNLELLHAYFLAAEEIRTREGKRINALDISTGPCLAPLMATMGCIDQVQLSDYDVSNREQIVNSDIGYWREYANELVRMFPDRNLSAEDLLSRLDTFRKESTPLDVDLRRSPMFLPDDIRANSVELMTMHFVVDSICETADECFELLGKTLTFVRTSGWLLLSTLIDSDGWQLGNVNEPSPNLSEDQIDAFLEKSGFDVISRTRSIRKAQQIYSGGWTVFLAQNATS
jgi:hypothetical protein